MDYSKVYKRFSPIIRKLYRLQIDGIENIPEGGCIIASNHTAFSDVLLISAAANGRQIRYMAKKELFGTPLKGLITSLGAFPVARGANDVGAIKKAITLIDEGEAFGIFPQGHRNGRKDPRTTEVRSGVGLIAYRSKAPVIPVMIENSRMKTGIFRKNHIIFGKPIQYDDLGFTSGGYDEFNAAAHVIFDRICELKYGSALPSGEKPALDAPENTK